MLILMPYGTKNSKFINKIASNRHHLEEMWDPVLYRRANVQAFLPGAHRIPRDGELIRYRWKRPHRQVAAVPISVTHDGTGTASA